MEGKKGGLGDNIRKAPPNLFNNKDAKKIVEGTIVIGSPPPSRPKNIPLVPIPATFSQIEPIKDYNRPPHYIGAENLWKNEERQRSLSQHSARIPTHCGSTYFGRPNHINGLNNQPPRNASVPKAYIPPHLDSFSEYSLLANRDTSGKILGSHVRRYVDTSKVPAGYVPEAEDIPVGPYNPVKVLGDGTWSACWDESAAAVYYYNNVTGQADWILPEIAQQQLRITQGSTSRPNTGGYQ